MPPRQHSAIATLPDPHLSQILCHSRRNSSNLQHSHRNCRRRSHPTPQPRFRDLCHIGTHVGAIGIGGGVSKLGTRTQRGRRGGGREGEGKRKKRMRRE